MAGGGGGCRKQMCDEMAGWGMSRVVWHSYDTVNSRLL